ncbi:amidohydrolase [Cytophagales bacterium RKSG123]|nr:amidohydrolase [Xanthovirga aplysinae]
MRKLNFKRILKSILTVYLLFFGLIVFGQNPEVETSIHKNVQKRTDEIFDNLIQIRRDLHTYPELSEQEKRTSKKIEEYLLSLGLEVKTNIGGYGVVGILNGHKAGKRIAWRADIDALASDFPDVVDFKSKNKGVRHICGHDIHTTIGLGIANILTSQKENIDGTVYFLFQPSEENYEGAKAMINDGLFDMIDPEEIYGLHIVPFPAGTIATKGEEVFAHYNAIKVSFKNSHSTDSLIDYTKKLISSFQNIKPESKFWDPGNLTDSNVGIGNPNTIFKNYLTVNEDFSIKQTNNEVVISTIIQSSNGKQLDSLIKSLKQNINESKYSKDLISVEYSWEKDVVLNDKNLAAKALNSITNIYGKQSVIPLYGEVPYGFGDDFAYFQNQVPGVYFFLGGANYEKGIISMPHTPNFDVDEDCIRTGVNFFSSMIIESLNNE